MTSRSAHYRNKARHAQREFGEVQPKLAPRDTSTAWMGPFIASLQRHTEPFGVNSATAMQLGPSQVERALRLRELCKLGVLNMSVRRVDGKFVEYMWELAPAGMFADS